MLPPTPPVPPPPPPPPMLFAALPVGLLTGPPPRLGKSASSKASLGSPCLLLPPLCMPYLVIRGSHDTKGHREGFEQHSRPESGLVSVRMLLNCDPLTICPSGRVYRQIIMGEGSKCRADLKAL